MTKVKIFGETMYSDRLEDMINDFLKEHPGAFCSIKYRHACSGNCNYFSAMIIYNED